MHRPRVVAVDVAVDVPELVGLVDVVAVVVGELVTVVVYRHESHRTGQFRSVASRVLGSVLLQSATVASSHEAGSCSPWHLGVVAVELTVLVAVEVAVRVPVLLAVVVIDEVIVEVAVALTVEVTDEVPVVVAVVPV